MFFGEFVCQKTALKQEVMHYCFFRNGGGDHHTERDRTDRWQCQPQPTIQRLSHWHRHHPHWLQSPLCHCWCSLPRLILDVELQNCVISYIYKVTACSRFRSLFHPIFCSNGNFHFLLHWHRGGNSRKEDDIHTRVQLGKHKNKQTKTEKNCK